MELINLLASIVLLTGLGTEQKLPDPTEYVASRTVAANATEQVTEPATPASAPVSTISTTKESN